jgi:hypothetical protein
MARIGVTIERGACRPGRVLTPGGSVFRATAHDAVHDAAHGAFMTLPPYPLIKEGEVKSLTFEGNFSRLRAKPAHFVGHLPVE